VQTTIIDFGLSRLNAKDGRVMHSEMHEEIFAGVGDQWDVYRSMREIAKDDWETYHPVTNVLVRNL
jgi:serine/threonine-protein kinase haspin